LKKSDKFVHFCHSSVPFPPKCASSVAFSPNQGMRLKGQGLLQMMSFGSHPQSLFPYPQGTPVWHMMCIPRGAPDPIFP
jgi:hypothetical protein